MRRSALVIAGVVLALAGCSARGDVARDVESAADDRSTARSDDRCRPPTVAAGQRCEAVAVAEPMPARRRLRSPTASGGGSVSRGGRRFHESVDAVASWFQQFEWKGGSRAAGRLRTQQGERCPGRSIPPRHPIVNNGLNAAPSAIDDPGALQPAIGGTGTADPLPGLVRGRVTFDLVPITPTGLNYAGTTVSPVRGVVVQLRDATETVLATTVTDDQGRYAFNGTAENGRIVVLATLDSDPASQVEVRDNTDDTLYTLRSVALSGANVIQNIDLHASSGWKARPSATSWNPPRGSVRHSRCGVHGRTADRGDGTNGTGISADDLLECSESPDAGQLFGR